MKYSNLRTCYVRIKDAKVETTNTVIKDRVYADFDINGKVVGFEFIDPSEVELNGEIKDVE